MTSQKPPGESLGGRVRRLRTGLGFTQAELADTSGIAAGIVSMLENDRYDVEPDTLISLARALDCSRDYLLGPAPRLDMSRPKLRAYADAPQRAVDQITFDSATAVDAISRTGLRLLSDALPVFTGDSSDESEIDRVAADSRATAGVDSDLVVPNVIRAAERLGCVVLPMDNELGRHWGLSLTVNDVPVVRVARASLDPELDIPGDRQRFTVAHEIGHLVLHAGGRQPVSPSDAAKMEREADRFAAAFLVPGDSALADLEANGGRVTLTTLVRMKQKWGYSIKAFVFRFKDLGVIDDAEARSLYKQISARRWNRSEPHRPGTEEAVWMKRALEERFPVATQKRASANSGLSERYFQRWLDWSPITSGRPEAGGVIPLVPRQKSSSSREGSEAVVSRLHFNR